MRKHAWLLIHFSLLLLSTLTWACPFTWACSECKHDPCLYATPAILPKDLLLEVFDHLSSVDQSILKSARVNRHWNRTSQIRRLGFKNLVQKLETSIAGSNSVSSLIEMIQIIDSRLCMKPSPRALESVSFAQIRHQAILKAIALAQEIHRDKKVSNEQYSEWILDISQVINNPSEVNTIISLLQSVNNSIDVAFILSRPFARGCFRFSGPFPGEVLEWTQRSNPAQIEVLRKIHESPNRPGRSKPSYREKLEQVDQILSRGPEGYRGVNGYYVREGLVEAIGSSPTFGPEKTEQFLSLLTSWFTDPKWRLNENFILPVHKRIAAEAVLTPKSVEDFVTAAIHYRSPSQTYEVLHSLLLNPFLPEDQKIELMKRVADQISQPVILCATNVGLSPILKSPQISNRIKEAFVVEMHQRFLPKLQHDLPLTAAFYFELLHYENRFSGIQPVLAQIEAGALETLLTIKSFPIGYGADLLWGWAAKKNLLPPVKIKEIFQRLVAKNQDPIPGHRPLYPAEEIFALSHLPGFGEKLSPEEQEVIVSTIERAVDPSSPYFPALYGPKFDPRNGFFGGNGIEKSLALFFQSLRQLLRDKSLSVPFRKRLTDFVQRPENLLVEILVYDVIEREPLDQ